MLVKHPFFGYVTVSEMGILQDVTDNNRDMNEDNEPPP